jgi:hypothetical protein
MPCRVRLLLLLASLAAAAPAAEPPAETSRLLGQAAELERQREEIDRKIQALTPELERRLTAYLPRLDGKLAGYRWGKLRYGVGLFRVDLLAGEDPGRRVLWVHLVDQRQKSARWKAAYSVQKRLGGYPAKEVKDRWLWLLVGNLELRATADPQQPDFQKAEALEELVKRFDLKALAGL